jgi:hypothetical protein
MRTASLFLIAAITAAIASLDTCQAQALISEFLSANSSGLRDEDGDSSDWLEIHNPTAVTINLEGWHLTDNDGNLDKWTFPSVEISPDGFLVVFASKKDRAVAGSELHTDFELRSGGEYLALVRPDLSVANEFSPEYPVQFSNTSFGLVANSSGSVLLDVNADTDVLIPADGSLANSWTGGAEPFDDSTWISGTTGVGFDAGGGGQFPDDLVGYWPLDNSAEETSGNRADAIFSGTSYQADVPAGIGTGASLQLDGINDQINLGDVNLTGGSIAMWIKPTDVGAGLGDRRLLSPASGPIAQGGALGIDPNGSSGDGSMWLWSGGGWLRMTANGVLQANVWQHLALVADGSQITLYLDGVAYNTAASPFDFNGRDMLVGAPFLNQYGNSFAGKIDDLSLWESALTPAQISSLAGGSSPSASTSFGLDVEAAMHGVNASAYLRSEFEVADPAALVQLILQMKYDDGFIAYLNGVEIARQNVTGAANWNLAADLPRPDEDVGAFQEFDISQHLPLLVTGTNVLAIHGLNASASDDDFLILPRLIDRGAAFLPGLVRYFTEPTPGAQNGAVAADVGPILSEVSEPVGALAATDPLLVVATATPTFEGVDGVLLRYRVMFGTEVSIAMLDDGAHGDGLAGDGIYGATIPAGVASAGQMLRYRVTASDNQANTSSWPPFADPHATPEYLGTMVDISITTSLPVLHYFTANPSAVGTTSGTRASLFYDGEFYENVWVHGRGSSGSNAGLRFEMNRGFEFRHASDAPRLRKFNTRSNAGEIAEMIAYELYHDAQTPAPRAFPMRFYRNGSFVGVDTFFDQVDEVMLKRNGLDDDGAMFKMFNSLTHPVNRSYTFYRHDNNKRTREWDPTWDLNELVAGVDENNPNRNEYVMDNVDVPAVINYLAATVLSCDYDHETHNYFMYRDNDGSGRWQVIPWDRNIAFITPTSDPTSHPFLGSSEYVHPSWANLEGKSNEQWSRLTDAIRDNPVTREMYLRRLRTLMDELLQPPGTPVAERKLETRLDEWAAILQSEDGGLANSAISIKSKVASRRNHLYLTHSIDNVGNYPNAAGIPHAQSGNPQVDFGPIEFNPTSGNQDEEYIRLDNPNGAAVDISGWQLTGGVGYTFPPGTVIPASGSLYVTPDVLTFLARATGPSGGQELFVQGNYAGHISNVGEIIELVAPDSEIVASILTPVEPSDAQLFLVVSEIMYHPDGDGLAEFIELTNISPSVTLDLSGVKFVNGIDFDFTGAAVTSLAPGARVLVVRDLAAFTLTHGGGHPVAGVFANTTRLSNDGEIIKLEDALNSTIKEFTYNDVAPWPTAADAGYSLVLIDPGSNPDPDSAINWRSSTLLGGNPGATDLVPFPANPLGDDDGNGTADLVDYAIGSDLGLPALAPAASFESYDINGSMQSLLTLSYPISLGAEGVSIGIDASTDLSTWTDAAPNMELVSQVNLGDGRAVVTVRFTSPIGDGERQFLRLRVEQQ